MNKKRKLTIKRIEENLNCELVFASANIMHFKAKTDDCPSNAELERCLPSNIKRSNNILFERVNPKQFDTTFIFAGMPNMLNYLYNTFGGHCPKPFIWRLHNMSVFDTDTRGYKTDVLPTGKEIREHILFVYNLLNPNCKHKDYHKKKVELLSYDKASGMWECGHYQALYTLKVKAPSYLGAGSSVYINTHKKPSESYNKIYEFYGKDLLKEEPDGDYAKLFALHPDAIYDWFYSQEHSIDDVVKMFEDIEFSFKMRPYLYYCKGEYNKVRNLFLSEAMRFMHLKSKEEIKSLPKDMRNSMLAICKHNQIAKSDLENLNFVFEEQL